MSALLFLVLLVVRLVGAGEGMIAMRTLPGGGSARWLGRLLDDFEFDTMSAVLAQRELLPGPATA